MLESGHSQGECAFVTSDSPQIVWKTWGITCALLNFLMWSSEAAGACLYWLMHNAGHVVLLTKFTIAKRASLSSISVLHCLQQHHCRLPSSGVLLKDSQSRS